MARKRVLVVDDLTPVVTAQLRESFDVVGMVSDGQAALESTLKLSPDLIVLAISMPGMSGIGSRRNSRGAAIMPRSYFSPFMRTRTSLRELLQRED